jgi:hypothetical protein
MANKTVSQLPLGASVALTDELEKQITGNGASQKCTAAQLLTFIQGNATAFSRPAVSFANVISGVQLNISSAINVGGTNIQLQAADGSATFANGNISFFADGHASFGAGGPIVLNADGSASLASGKLSIQSDGGLIINGGTISLFAGGTSFFGTGNAGIGSDGSAFFSNNLILLNANGSASFANGVTTVAASGDVEIGDTTQGLILKSPNGTRYRLKVNDGGQLGTEPA